MTPRDVEDDERGCVLALFALVAVITVASLVFVIGVLIWGWP